MVGDVARGRLASRPLRDPQTEWKGPWSDSSPLWTPKLSAELGHSNKDGELPRVAGCLWLDSVGALTVGCSGCCDRRDILDAV